MAFRSACLPRPHPALHVAAALLPVVAAGCLANLATIPNLDWYATLVKPTFNPPNVVFGPVWTVLYLLMARGFYFVLRQPDYVPDRPAAIRLFLVQIALNASWSGVFFAAHSPGLALLILVALLLTVILTTMRFSAVDRRAGRCLMPYILWLCFAGLLNLSIWILNR